MMFLLHATVRVQVPDELQDMDGTRMRGERFGRTLLNAPNDEAAGHSPPPLKQELWWYMGVVVAEGHYSLTVDAGLCLELR